MSYLILRDCFVGGRFFAKGTIQDVPDDIEKSPKNFQPVDSEGIPIKSKETAKWVNPLPASVQPPPEPSSEPTGDSVEEAPLYVSPNPKPKHKKKKRR